MVNIKNRFGVTASIENASVLRKFTVLFLMMSLLPMTVLYYFFVQIQDLGQIQISETAYSIMLIFIVLGVLLGYFTMRKMIISLISLAHANRKALESVLQPHQIKELSEEKNEIAVLAKTFDTISSRLEDNVRNLELTKRTLHSVMSKVGDGISGMQNIDSFLELILETVTDALSAKVGVILLYNEKLQEMSIKTLYGISDANKDNFKIKFLTPEHVRMLNKAKSPSGVAVKLLDIERISDHPEMFSMPMLAAPLVVEDHTFGFLVVSGRKRKENYKEDDIELLTNLAKQTAVAMRNSQLSDDVEATYFETISALALAVEAKDKFSRGHSERVSKLCVKIGEKLGLEDQDIKTIRDAARLHDVGKIGIPEEVLSKEGPLTHQEWELMKRHPEIGESIITPIKSLRHLANIIRSHHEKLDGSGYPDGLREEQISPLVRILTIADIFDALTAERRYRPKLSNDAAIAEMRKMEVKIDQDIVEVFADALRDVD